MTGFKAVPRLTRHVILEERVPVPDGAGGARAEWTELGRMWVAIDSGTGRATAEAGVVRSFVPMKIILRSAPSGSSMRPRPDQRFREGARLYAITAVAEDDPRGRYLTCYAKEEVAQ
ncbi:MAG: head-tail adaptor protein [Pseudomonadota bacterium]